MWRLPIGLVAKFKFGIVASLLATIPLAGSASEAPLTVLSDPVASYFVLERQSYITSVKALNDKFPTCAGIPAAPEETAANLPPN